jgi:hypothetical protein
VDVPRISSVECPACGEQQEVVLAANAAMGAVVRRECPEGHEFWIRVNPTSLEVLAEKPEPGEDQ